jgi:hypothetical protein
MEGAVGQTAPTNAYQLPLKRLAVVVSGKSFADYLLDR